MTVFVEHDAKISEFYFIEHVIMQREMNELIIFKKEFLKKERHSPINGVKMTSPTPPFRCFSVKHHPLSLVAS